MEKWAEPAGQDQASDDLITAGVDTVEGGAGEYAFDDSISDGEFNAETATKPDLVAFLADKKIKHHHKLGEDKLRTLAMEIDK